jgi:hypothetical protein
VRIDRIIADLGLAAVEGDCSPATEARIAEEAEGFLRAGGTLSWSEWVSLSDVSQRAFTLAGDRVRRETAGLIGAAVRVDFVDQALLSGEDVDAVRRRNVLRSACEEVSAGGAAK